MIQGINLKSYLYADRSNPPVSSRYVRLLYTSCPFLSLFYSLGTFFCVYLLKDHKLLKKAGGENKLVQLLERTVSAINIDRLARLVQEKYQHRQLIATK
jgi:hypothetical protein